MKRVRRIAGAVCLALAAMCVLLAWSDHQDWQTTLRWRKVQARVVQADWQEYQEHARIVYDYDVDGRTFRSESREFSDVSRQRWAHELLRSLMKPLDATIDREHPELAVPQFAARSEAEETPPGSAVEAWCDPASPERSILTYLPDSQPTKALSLFALGLGSLGGLFFALKTKG